MSVYVCMLVAGGDGGGQAAGNEAMESEDGTGPSGDRPSQTVEGLFGDAADLSSSLVTPDPMSCDSHMISVSTVTVRKVRRGGRGGGR